jgi:hypothetical protein
MARRSLAPELPGLRRRFHDVIPFVWCCCRHVDCGVRHRSPLARLALAHAGLCCCVMASAAFLPRHGGAVAVLADGRAGLAGRASAGIARQLDISGVGLVRLAVPAQRRPAARAGRLDLLAAPAGACAWPMRTAASRRWRCCRTAWRRRSGARWRWLAAWRRAPK